MAILEEKNARGPVASQGQGGAHRLCLTGRETLTMSGIKDVLAFDASEILLETTLGMLSIRGSELHVKRLTLEKGEVDVTGKIDSLVYADVGTYKKQGESLFARLFH